MRTMDASAPEGPRLSDLLAAGPVVLDGAMGTELDSRGVDTRHALWSARALLEDPDVVAAVHSDYLAAGARILTTNSYQASAPTFRAAGLSRDHARRALEASVRIARTCAERFEATRPASRILVAGGIGPFGAHLADGSEYTGDYSIAHTDNPVFEQVHRSRLEVLAGQGLGLFALETMPRLDEARAVIALMNELAPGCQCWVSFQLRSDGEHLADGTPLERAAAWAEVEPAVVAVGLNCVAPAVVAPALAVLRASTGKPLVAYPNSGDGYDPVAKTWTSAPPAERFTALAEQWLDGGARLIGGCCRTTPADTAALARVVASRTRAT